MYPSDSICCLSKLKIDEDEDSYQKLMKDKKILSQIIRDKIINQLWIHIDTKLLKVSKNGGSPQS